MCDSAKVNFISEISAMMVVGTECGSLMATTATADAYKAAAARGGQQ